MVGGVNWEGVSLVTVSRLTCQLITPPDCTETSRGQYISFATMISSLSTFPWAHLILTRSDISEPPLCTSVGGIQQSSTLTETAATSQPDISPAKYIRQCTGCTEVRLTVTSFPTKWLRTSAFIHRTGSPLNELTLLPFGKQFSHEVEPYS